MEESSTAPESTAAEGTVAAATPAVAAAPEDAEAAPDDAGSEGDEDIALMERAQKLIVKIVESQSNPNPKNLHALASIFETEESRYLKECACSCLNNARASHTIGKLGNLVRENDDFYEVISSKFLSESQYSVSVRAAAARLVLSCSSSWMYTLVFDDAVLDNIKSWVMEDNLVSADDCTLKRELVGNPLDLEMLKTYATGLLALSLTGGSQVVEDMLTSGLSAKLMHYLRIRVIGEASSSKKDDKLMTDNKHAAVACSIRGKEETRVRLCYDDSHLVGQKVGDDGLLSDPRGVWRGHGIDYSGDVNSLKSELTDSFSEVAGTYEVIEEDAGLDGDGWQNKNLLDGKSKHSERFTPNRLARDEDADDNMRDDLSRRRLNRVLSRTRSKVRTNEGGIENERILVSPNSISRLGVSGRGSRDNIVKNEDAKMVDAKDVCAMPDGLMKGDVDDERLRNCFVGSRDISEMVKKAIVAAEAEARRVNAPAEAVKAAGDAAAELVMSAASEALSNSNDEEAAVSAASEAASTVVDAATMTEISWSANKVDDVLPESDASETKVDEDVEDFFLLDEEPLARLREKYCIQCLETLGEYVEALGPILHEKGVDVCLALLHRSLKDEEAPDPLALLPEVLKLICALAAHRKFAAVFVDRGGMQKLLSVRRVSQTFFGLSSCLFTIGSLQGIMERVCALPSEIVHRVVELALQLLECTQDQARKNAAIFFVAAFVFRAVLESFDAQEGLQKMLNLLHSAASVRAGGNAGTLRIPNAVTTNDRSSGEVLTAIEKQIAYHTCVALRQYFRAHLLLLVDSLRPNKSSRSIARNNPRAAYKPLDLSHEAIDAVFLLIQRDRKLGPALVRARWPAVDKFLASNGHVIMLELCQAPPVDRYLHDLAQYALGVLHIVTFVPYSRKLIVNATLTNNRVGMAVILDAANGVGFVDPEVIHPALNVLVNLVCPPPSISNKPSPSAQGQQPVSVQTPGASDNRERHFERNTVDPVTPSLMQNESRERHVETSQADRSNALTMSTIGVISQSPATSMPSAVVGDRRISLGPGAGCAGLAAQLEQGYRQARDAVRANNGIKTLIQLLNPRMITPLAALDCIRALACRVLLGLARDDTIAHILTKLQVGKKLSELIRDSSSQASGVDQRRWQSELVQVAIELISIVTNSGRASTLAATDAAAPTLRRIERAAIAAATPITYHSRELLLLIHEHLQASGLTTTAALLQKEADLTPLPSVVASAPLLHPMSAQETTCVPLQWPAGRASCGFYSEATIVSQDEDSNMKPASTLTVSKTKPLIFSSTLIPTKPQQLIQSSSTTKPFAVGKGHTACEGVEASLSSVKCTAEAETQLKTPIVLPLKRKFLDLKVNTASPAKRVAAAENAFQTLVNQTPSSLRRNTLPIDPSMLTSATPRDPFSKAASSSLHMDNLEETHCHNNPGAPSTPAAHLGLADSQPGNTERMTLDSLVVQYLKHQHRQCPAPITTLPPLSLLHPHVCPEPSRSLNAPTNVTARVSTREFKRQYGGVHAHRRDRQFIYSRFRPCRTCRDDAALLTCLTFLGDSSRIATGCHSGELKIFDSNSGNILESQSGHQSPVTLVQSTFSGGNQLLLSSAYEVKLWDASSITGGPLHSFDGCKAARFSHSGDKFAALTSESSSREVRIFDVQTSNVELRLPDSSTNHVSLLRGHAQSLIHFSPLDTLILWNGTLWDRRSSNVVRQFDQFSDYGGGGFHPAGNEVIINSEVWDLRKFRLLRTVPSLDQTVITFNGGGDIIYAILRRNLEDITSAVHTRRVRHPLFPAFRTIDSVNYCDIATVQVDRCVLDFATDPTDSFVGVIAMDDHQQMYSSSRLYEVGRKRPTDDDSDPDDGGDTDEESDEENDDSDADIEQMLDADLEEDADTDSDDLINEEDEDLEEELDEDGDFNLDDFEGGQGLLEIMAEGDEEGDDDDDGSEVSFSSEEDDFAGNGFDF